MPHYHVHGLIFESELDLPPLLPCSTAQKKAADVQIRISPVSETGLDSTTLSSPYIQTNNSSIWINIPNTARIQANKGKEILVDILDNADEASALLFIFGTGMGAILHQRGHLVLHANAVLVEDQLILIIGDSGAGKSTIAAAFHKLGYPVISDDVVAIHSGLRVAGGFPQIKLCLDTLEKLNIDKNGLNRISSKTGLEIEKFSLPLHPIELKKPLPIAAIYILETSKDNSDNRIQFRPLTGIAKFNNLKRYTYKKALLNGLGLEANHLEISSALANNLNIVKIIRPKDRFSIDEIIAQIHQDLESQTDTPIVQTTLDKQ